MTLTLLVDLDDTLLSNNMGIFLPAYLKALSGYLQEYAVPENLVSSLMTATDCMIKNTDPSLTLKNVFDSQFFKLINVQREQIQPTIDRFYITEFAKLKPLTQPAPGAIEFIEEAFRRGYKVLIATNPLFPLQAVVHRLTWAGLSPEKYPFSLIPSYETFHFAKPNPAYFYELVDRIGFPDYPILMVGDDYKMDIESAREGGLAAYWINEETLSDNFSPVGKLDQVFAWIDQNNLVNNFEIPTQPVALLAALRSTPAVLPFLCDQLPEEKWSQRPEPIEWCQTEILCHLRDVEKDVNLQRIEKITKEDYPFIAGKDTDIWAVERNYIQQDGIHALNDFIETRKAVIHFLDCLSQDAWQKNARHAIFGPTTFIEMIKIIASHDRLHLQQISKTQKQISD